MDTDDQSAMIPPRYQRLSDELAEAIHGGRLPVGSRLPSLRQMALQRRLSLNTVIAAYRQLEDAGLVFSGKAPNQPIMQILELPSHPYFFGTQAHPCLTSRPLKPHPMFVGLVAAAMRKCYPDTKLPDGVKAVREVCKLAGW